MVARLKGRSNEEAEEGRSAGSFDLAGCGKRGMLSEGEAKAGLLVL